MAESVRTIVGSMNSRIVFMRENSPPDLHKQYQHRQATNTHNYTNNVIEQYEGRDQKHLVSYNPKQLIGKVVVEYRNPTTPPMAYEAK